jgi:hypothetical protein
VNALLQKVDTLAVDAFQEFYQRVSGSLRDLRGRIAPYAGSGFEEFGTLLQRVDERLIELEDLAGRLVLPDDNTGS